MKPTERNRHAYLPEIDGLRAVAILPVVAYHAGLGGGGYVGVDVFFVISGYLISGILFRELEAGRFELASFYERRARRILPALVPVLLLSLVAGLFWLLPDQLVSLGQSTLTTVGFGSNVFFWRQTGYFTGNGELSPLLHTWSLSIEEQFYLFFPLLLRVLPPRRWVVALVVLIVASFGLSVYALARWPAATFFLLPTRGWELGLGGILALAPRTMLASRAAREGLGLVGIAAIAGAVLSFDASTPFPGVAALAPALGTGAVILGGGETRVGRALGSRPMRGVGLVSYSLYLWHWPLLVFGKHALVTAEPPLGVRLALVGASFVLAFVSWRWVERPFRDPARFTRRRIFAWSGVAMAGVAAAAATMLVSGGFPQRLTAAERAFDTIGFDARGEACLNAPIDAASDRCHVGVAGRPSVVIWGDSHAASMFEGLDVALRAANRSGVVFAFNGCPPFEGDALAGLAGLDHPNCVARNQEIVRALDDDSIDAVVLIAYWSSHRHAADFDERLTARTAELARPGREIVLVVGLPEPGYDVRWGLARAAPTPDAVRPASWAGPPGTRAVSLTPAFCAPSCPVVRGSMALFYDDNHITSDASREVVGPFLATHLFPLVTDG